MTSFEDIDRLSEATFGPTNNGRASEASKVDRSSRMTAIEAELLVMDDWCFGPGPDPALLTEAKRVLAAGPSRGLVQERRTSTQTRPRVVESGRGTPTGDGTLSICLIDAGAGSSGYYPPATLEAAARAKVFGKGLQLFIDHPTQTEQYDRPERSVRDLAGVLAEDATYRDGGLYATATVFSAFRSMVTDMASAIGMSIRAEAVVENGEVGTYRGPVVTEITRAVSCDFVTAAGRGGRILSAS